MNFECFGHADQRLLVRNTSIEDGPGRGMRAIHVMNRAGLFLEILPDRGLDIAAASWQGKSLVWLSAAGLRHPNTYEPKGIGWILGFVGGLVTTCGLDQAGAPSTENGIEYGLHGRYSYIPAEEVATRRVSDKEGNITAEISGRVSQSAVFLEKLVLERKITVPENSPYLVIEDVVKNAGHRDEPMMLLYHMNFGYPLIEDGTRVVLPKGTKTIPRDAEAKDGQEKALTACAPTKGYREKVYYHEVPAAAEAEVRLVNPAGWGVKITYSHDTLTELTQWKMMGQGDYVMGIEPGNCRVSGRAEERKAGRLKILAPGQEISTRVKVEVLPKA